MRYSFEVSRFQTEQPSPISNLTWREIHRIGFQTSSRRGAYRFQIDLLAGVTLSYGSVSTVMDIL